MAYVASCQKVMIFGGENGTNQLGETWVWDGTNWTDVTPALPGNSPSARSGAGCAYDSMRDVVVLFGGVAFGGDPQYNDTWEWNCATQTWIEINPKSSPPEERDSFAISYAGNGHVAIFGGATREASPNLGDTWVWDGTDWTDVTPVQSPSLRRWVYMSYDEYQDSVLLFGGFDTTYLNDTWEGTLSLDGETPSWTWTAITVATSPSVRDIAYGLTYDPIRRVSVLFGGNGPSGDLNDTWLYRNGDEIPAISAWGLILLALGFVALATLRIMRAKSLRNPHPTHS